MEHSDSYTSKYLLKMTGGLLKIFICIIFYMIVFAVTVRAAMFAYDFAYQVFGSVAMSEAPGIDINIHIADGETVTNIAAKLENSKLIKNRYAFRIKVKLKEYNIKPGTFKLNTSMDYDKILEVITDDSNAIQEE